MDFFSAPVYPERNGDRGAEGRDSSTAGPEPMEYHEYGVSGTGGKSNGSTKQKTCGNTGSGR